MGKRELLLVVGFVIIGAAVYQFTAPPPPPGQQGFSFRRLIDNMRHEVAGNRASTELVTKKQHTVAPSVTELRTVLRAESLTIIGEDRPDVASELNVRSSGYDDAEARRLAAETHLLPSEAGDRFMIDMFYPRAGRQRAALTLRVPQRLRVHLERYNGKLTVTNVAEVVLYEFSGEATVQQVKKRVTVSQRGGELTMSDVATVKLNTRGADVRLTRMQGDLTVQSSGGDIVASEIVGGIDVESNGTDLRFERLEKLGGQIRVNATNGSIKLTDVSTETRIDGRNAEIAVTMSRAVPISIYNDGRESIEVTPATGGYQLDALATAGGRITVPDGAPEVKSGDNDQRATGAVRGGGPAITLRANRGEIIVRAAGAAPAPPEPPAPPKPPTRKKTLIER
jgi:hypothetical protein